MGPPHKEFEGVGWRGSGDVVLRANLEGAAALKILGFSSGCADKDTTKELPKCQQYKRSSLIF